MSKVIEYKGHTIKVLLIDGVYSWCIGMMPCALVHDTQDEAIKSARQWIDRTY